MILEGITAIVHEAEIYEDSTRVAIAAVLGCWRAFCGRFELVELFADKR
jgi:hypothetical protein